MIQYNETIGKYQVILDGKVVGNFHTYAGATKHYRNILRG